MPKTILSLFDYTGNWSQPYRDAGYNVIQIDTRLGDDILEWDYTTIESVHGILAAPPCKDFSIAGNRWWAAKDADGRTDASLALIDKTLEIINHFAPQWWAIENPPGRLPRLRPELGKPWYFHPYDFGDPYTKKTGLFGEFTPPLPTIIGGDWSVKPMPNYRRQDDGSYVSGGPMVDKYFEQFGANDRSVNRAATPPGFAKAFFIANP